MIRAHEIQGILALENSFNQVGLDHVLLVKMASTARCRPLHWAHTRADQRTFPWPFSTARRAHLSPCAEYGQPQSWAAGDATSRGRLALIARTGEMGYPSVLTAKTWGFYDVSFKGQSFEFQREYGSYVMENVLFKISFPAEFHAQTAVEAAMTINEKLRQAGKTGRILND